MSVDVCNMHIVQGLLLWLSLILHLWEGDVVRWYQGNMTGFRIKIISVI